MVSPVQIDDSSPEHPYVQVANWLRGQIKAGRIGPRIPPLMKLAEETGASVATVRRATKLLMDEGLIYSVVGRGTFVRKP
jgi:DNA-binding GntR family transcriptional regulator